MIEQITIVWFNIFFMSGEQVTNFKFKNSLKKEYLDKRKKVNINILLNKVRADEKREQLESNIFFGLVQLPLTMLTKLFLA